MKKSIFYLSILLIIICSGCKKDEVIDSKPGESIGPVTNLNHSVSGNTVNLTWKLPATLPNDIITPVAVVIQVAIDGKIMSTVTLDNAPASYTYSPYDSSKKYRFTVKVKGNVNSTDPNVSKLRYSLGETLSL